MPSDIDPHPKVQAAKNGAELTDVTSEVTEGADGYTVKVYNPGQEGDIVEVDLTWNLKNLLFLYDDIAELNWQPLTDSSGTIGKFEFHVRGDMVALIILFVWTIFRLSVELNFMHTGLGPILLALGIRD